MLGDFKCEWIGTGIDHSPVAWFLRSAFRKGDQASARDQDIGFRVATSLAP